MVVHREKRKEVAAAAVVAAAVVQEEGTQKEEVEQAGNSVDLRGGPHTWTEASEPVVLEDLVLALHWGRVRMVDHSPNQENRQ